MTGTTVFSLTNPLTTDAHLISIFTLLRNARTITLKQDLDAMTYANFLTQCLKGSIIPINTRLMYVNNLLKNGRLVKRENFVLLYTTNLS